MRAIFIPFPIATIAILIVTGILTGLQFVFPPILPALERTPTALAQHEWWRLVTPLLVHSDGWKQIAFNFPAILVVGVWVERIFGSGWLLLMYGVCGFVGEICGYAWQASGAGASIAGAGLLGALAFWLIAENRTLRGKVGGALILAGAITLVLLKNIHGPPVIAGACIAGFQPSKRQL
jgi:membrane associated rhomboid family serine protease